MTEQKYQIGEEVYVDYDNWSWRAVVIEYLPNGTEFNPFPAYRVQLTEPGVSQGKQWLAYETNMYRVREAA